MIRVATHEDVEVIVAMAIQFLEATPYGTQIAIVPDRLRTFATGLLNNPDAVIALAVDKGSTIGMLAAWIFAHPFSGELIASELVWWVDPAARGSAGVRLLKWVEHWARLNRVAVLQMVAPTTRVGDLYAACGYQPIEVSYQKRF